MQEHIAWLFVGLGLLYFGAEWLVKGASDIALKVGISPLVVGLTVVAFGTSAPELLVCLDANGKGESGIALGNVIGSNICNIALILGVAALMRPIVIDRQIIKRELPILVLSSLIFVAMLVGSGTGDSAGIMRWEGLLLTMGIMVYVISSFLKARKEGSEDFEEFSEGDVKNARRAGILKILFSILLVGLGLFALKFGSENLVFHGKEMAILLGVNPALIALLLIAFGTSLPELATSVVAARRGQGDLITGNAIGSCVFNILAVVGITALVKPIVYQGVKPFDLWVMLGLSIGIIPFMWSKMRLSRAEGGILLLVYLGYCGILLAMQEGKISF